PPKQKKEYIRSDEVLFILQNADGDFDRSLNYYAAAIDLHASATGNAKNVYKLKADGYLREMQTWLKSHFKDAYIAQYNGQSKPMMDWLKGTSVRNISGLGDSQIGSLKDIFESVASHILANHFVSLAPEYPTFSQWITYENIESAAKDALSVVSGGAATKRANAVLDALELLDGDKISPLQSRYAQAVLAVLQSKPQGQVVNQAELLEAINSRLYFKPEIFRLEPEWLLVLIACLVYSGELELVVVGHTLTASDVVKFKSISFDVLKDFKHIQAPKDFNITALKSLLTLLDMNDGLATSIQQGDESIVREMLKRTEMLINELVKGHQSVKDRLPLWGQSVLEEGEEQTLSTQLSELKNFLETIQRYDKPGKLKNLKATAAEIAAFQQILQAWHNFVQLKLVVNELAPLCAYLKEAQLVLPEQLAWQEQVKLARDALRQGLADPVLRGDESFKSAQINALTALKAEYAKHYIELYMRVRLDSSEEKTKAKLLSDERLAELDILSGIALLPAQQLADWRKDAAQLQAAKPIDPKQLTMNANPAEFNARQESGKAPASEQLKNLEQRLDSIQSDWLSNLNSLLDDPFINLELLKPDQAQLIRDFIQQGQLPEPMDFTFVQAVNLVLAGLEEVRISSVELVNALGQGMPQSRDEMSDRFNRLLTKLCQGKDLNKVRIIID
ncbi:TPA: hypothetical protein N3Y94_004014, partial [Klebsiella quasipneumoniae]|nr:hypothetical protein [Klebsiella quasipneumoniae]HCM6936383.1 hypothetical protein [Klebsiella quasipneumoniae subsp. similipneumoniae]HCM5558832.1 hypothetical protein [Klebsiella quasipneumoniae]HCM5710264.1 hypothetical protein [Klebsiella quasipneumoniae]HCM5885326.1 hypothetical protein [Klebsiella quasipneumoniae]